MNWNRKSNNNDHREQPSPVSYTHLLTGKVLENGLVAQVSHVILVGQNVDAAHPGPCIAELFRNGFSNPLCAAGDDGDPI